jgi:hypothetical protein
MRKSALLLLTLSSIPLASALCASCAEKPPATVAVDLLCTETTRYHTTDHQRAAAKADPSTWFSLFQWLASFDAVRDKRCTS